VYQDLDPDSLITSNDTIYLDIDADGVNDIMFWIESKAGTILSSGGMPIPYFYRFAYADGLNANAILGKPTTFSSYVFNSAYVLNSGDFIGDTIPKLNAKARLAGFISLDGAVVYSGGPWAGVSEGYLGIRFKISDATHFSWIRLSVGEGASSIRVSELAYDNQVDAGIVAGTVTAIEAANETQLDAHIYSSLNILHILLSEIPALTTCEIYSLTGQLVYSMEITNTHTSVPLQNICSGLYIIKLQQGVKRIQQKVFLTF
ncbi:MAG: T9SS type A sorting domain-containing protein, partial [Chitinophagales bacterium]